MYVGGIARKLDSKDKNDDLMDCQFANFTKYELCIGIYEYFLIPTNENMEKYSLNDYICLYLISSDQNNIYLYFHICSIGNVKISVMHRGDWVLEEYVKEVYLQLKNFLSEKKREMFEIDFNKTLYIAREGGFLEQLKKCFLKNSEWLDFI